MITHFAADGSVKRQWPEGLHATTFERDGKTIAQIQGSNAVLGDVELAAGDQVGESFAVPAEALQELGQRAAQTASTLDQTHADAALVDHDPLQKVLETAHENATAEPAQTVAQIADALAAADVLPHTPITEADLEALNGAVHTIQEVANHIAHPHAAQTNLEDNKFVQSAEVRAAVPVSAPAVETHADPAAAAPETPQQ